MDAMPFPWVLWLCRCAQTTAAVLLTGAAVLRLLSHGTGLRRADRWPRLAWASWAGLLVAGVILLGLTAAEMSGEPISQALADGSVSQTLGDTRFGAVWCWRMGLLAGWLAVRWAATANLQRWPLVPMLLEAVEMLFDAALLVSLVLAGHAQASDRSVWLLPANICHVLAAGAWPGGLPPLLLLLARVRKDARLLPAVVTVTRRFSRLSVAAVGVLAFSGLLNGAGMVGTFAALWSSPYGRLVLCKAVLFALMIGLGGVNRRLVRLQPNDADPAQTMHRLWRNVAWEGTLAMGVLLATEALAVSAPPTPSNSGITTTVGEPAAFAECSWRIAPRSPSTNFALATIENRDKTPAVIRLISTAYVPQRRRGTGAGHDGCPFR